jgi:acyl carrier protein
MHDQARELMATVFRLKPDDIGESAVLGGLQGWDSLGHMRLVLAIEASLARTLEPHEVVSVRSLADVAVLLQKK